MLVLPPKHVNSRLWSGDKRVPPLLLFVVAIFFHRIRLAISTGVFMAEERATPKPYTVLAAIGEPEHLAILLEIGARLARAQGGHVIPLCVSSEPSGPAWLVVPSELGDVVEQPQIMQHGSVSSAILEAARQVEPDLLLLHWHGRPSRGRYLLGRTLDPVIQSAPCDVAVVRANEGAPEFVSRLARLNRVLVPCGGGPNAGLALEIGLALGESVRVTALRVANKNLGPTAIAAQWELLKNMLLPWEKEPRLEPHVALADAVLSGILQEASREDCDLVLLGATAENFVDRLVFGNLPQEIAQRSPVPVIIIRRRDPTPAAALRRARWRLLGMLPQLTLEERIRVYRQVRRDARVDTDFYVMMMLAAGIATIGLLLDSAAVIIGAMLVAPLISALVSIGLGIVQGDGALLRLGLRATIVGVLLVILVSIMLGLAVPGVQLTNEMLSRSNPSLLDLAVAIISGVAAAYATCRRDVASALPGVAIAVALVPPLATAGLAAIAGDQRVTLGALLLFITNLTAIVSAVALIFLWVGFHPNIGQEIRARTFRGGLLGTAVLLVLVTAVLGILSARSVHHTRLQATIRDSLNAWLPSMGQDVALSEWHYSEDSRANTVIRVTVQSTRKITQGEIATLRQYLEERLHTPIVLSVTVIGVTHLSDPPRVDSWGGTPP